MAFRPGAVVCSLAALAVPAWFSAYGAPLGSAFTYQGQLKESGQPASGLYDLQVCLFDGPANPVPISCAPDFGDVPVDAGLFTIALDFGITPFVGEARYLEFRVRPGASSGGYSILAPRQAIRSTPEALRSASSSAAPWSGLSGVPAGFADGIDDNSGGTVSSIATGTGLSGGPITGSGTIAIANAGVGSAQIADGGVQAVDVAADALGTGQIATNGVGASELADNAVDSAALANASVTSAKIAAGAVGASQIAASAVGLAQIDSTQVQSRVAGACPVGTYLRGINPDGTAVCAEIPGVNAITTVDEPANAVGIDSDIAIGADGIPVISHYEATLSALRVTKCANAACSGVATATTLDNQANNLGSNTSIAIGLDGLPVVSYQDFTAGTLKVAKCLNPACTGAPTITTVDDPATFVGSYTALAVGADGRPVIAHHDVVDGTLRVAKCANAACTGAATITVVDDPAAFVGAHAALAIGADGLPVISYQDVTAGALKVAKCANAACTGAATVTTVDDTANSVGFDTSIAIGVDGLPIVSYFDDTADALKVAKCSNAACTGTALITTLDDQANSVGSHTSIAIGADGLPVISYQDFTAGVLKVAKCANVDCTGAATLTTVDDPPSFVGAHTAMAIGADGLPVIAYEDASAGALKVVKCGSRSCR